MNNRFKIPHSKPVIEREDYDAVTGALDSGWLTGYGAEVGRFEREFAEYIGVPYAVSANSCASALLLACLDNVYGGEVILPSLTHQATANAVMLAGGTPVFVDIDEDTLGITPETIEPAITRRTEAIIAVHIAGLPCDMPAIVDLATRHGLSVIEDSAECIGGEVGGRKAGSFGHGCFSFFATKNLATGEGGMVTTHHPPERMRCYSDQGYAKAMGIERERFWKRQAVLVGYNLRMSNLTAALGRAQLGRVDVFNEARRQAARQYRFGLKARNLNVWTQAEPEGYKHVYQMFLIRVPEDRRDGIVFDLRKRGVEATVHFDPPVHLHPVYQEHYFGGSYLPVTEQVAAELITLPMFPDMSYDDVEFVLDALAEAMDETSEL